MFLNKPQISFQFEHKWLKMAKLKLVLEMTATAAIIDLHK